jgi:hypothetical protein
MKEIEMNDVDKKKKSNSGFESSDCPSKKSAKNRRVF